MKSAEQCRMGYARSLLIDSSVPGVYHCVSRCVRRAFLCGEDTPSGRNFDHRKQWIEDRLLALAEIFAASVLAYAVMSNHVHVVVRMDPDLATKWSDAQIAERWVKLFAATRGGRADPGSCNQRIAALTGNPARLALLRQRLGNLSWFMRCLAEPIARRANREDDCTGRFWEGRFKCQALLDDRAVLACMAYVDLNPVRAGIADSLADSAHTSIQRRIRDHAADDGPVNAVAGADIRHLIAMRNDEYIALVDWTGRQLHPVARGKVKEPPPRILRQDDAAGWLKQVRGTESRYWRAIGSLEALAERALALGQCWLKGGRQRAETA
jgi:REP element-mobilizing transposase RayT